MSVVRFRPSHQGLPCKEANPCGWLLCFRGQTVLASGPFPGCGLLWKASHTSPPVNGFIRSARVRQPIFRTDTTGTPRLNKLIRRASVPAVPEETLETSTHYHAECLGIARSLNDYIAAQRDIRASAGGGESRPSPVGGHGRLSGLSLGRICRDEARVPAASPRTQAQGIFLVDCIPVCTRSGAPRLGSPRLSPIPVGLATALHWDFAIPPPRSHALEFCRIQDLRRGGWRSPPLRGP